MFVVDVIKTGINNVRLFVEKLRGIATESQGEFVVEEEAYINGKEV